jgi:hypothetical protein
VGCIQLSRSLSFVHQAKPQAEPRAEPA